MARSRVAVVHEDDLVQQLIVAGVKAGSLNSDGGVDAAAMLAGAGASYLDDDAPPVPPLRPGASWHFRLVYRGISSVKLRSILDFHFTSWQPAEVAADARSGELFDELSSSVQRAMVIPFHVSGECHRKLMFNPTSHNFGASDVTLASSVHGVTSLSLTPSTQRRHSRPSPPAVTSLSR